MRQVPRERIPMRKRLLRLSVPLALNDALRAGLNTAEQLLIPIGLARYGGSTEEAMAGYGTIHGMVFPILMFPAPSSIPSPICWCRSFRAAGPWGAACGCAT